MGFLSNILSASEDKELSKIKFLVTMIACDGEVTPDELEHLKEILKGEHVSQDRINQAMNMDISQLPDKIPTSHTKRCILLAELLGLMCSDGKCTMEEVSFYKYMHKKLGILLNADEIFEDFVNDPDMGFSYTTRQKLKDSYNRYKYGNF